MNIQNYNYIHNGVRLAPRLLPSITASARAKYKDDNRIKKINKNLSYDRRNARATGKKRCHESKTPENLNYSARRSPPCNDLNKSWMNSNEKDFMQLFQPNHGTTNLSSQNGSTLYNSNSDSGNSSHAHGREGGGCVSQSSNDLNSNNNNNCASGNNIYNGSRQMSSDNLRGVLPHPIRNSASPTPAYPQTLPGSLLRSDDKLHTTATENNNNNRKYSGSYVTSDNNNSNNNNHKFTGPYGSSDSNINQKTPSLLNVTSTSLGKDNAWGEFFQSKNTPVRKVVFATGAAKGSQGVGAGGPAGGARRKSSTANASTCSRCLALYHSASTNVKNKWTLLLLFHCSLFLVLALYLALGVTILFEVRKYTLRYCSYYS